jgi:hypothetical protein
VEVTILQRNHEGATKERKCSLHGDMMQSCPDYVRKPLHAEIIESAKKELKLNDFTLFFEDADEESFYEMNADEKRELCCVLCKCRPARQLLNKVRKCPAFISAVIKKLMEKLIIDEAEALEKYEILMNETDDKLVEMEKNAHKKSQGYLDFNIALATAMYAAQTGRKVITQFFAANIFHVTETSLRTYLGLA